MRQGAIYFNGQTKWSCFIFDGQTPQRLAWAIRIMHEFPTPDIVLSLGPGLNSASGPELSSALAARGG